MTLIETRPGEMLGVNKLRPVVGQDSAVIRGEISLSTDPYDEIYRKAVEKRPEPTYSPISWNGTSR